MGRDCFTPSLKMKERGKKALSPKFEKQKLRFNSKKKALNNVIRNVDSKLFFNIQNLI